MFVDKVNVELVAGSGGNGSVSFHHDLSKPRGGPDGGDGGNGGDIILSASRNQNTLAAFRYKKLLKADDGQPGREAKKHGRTGQNMIVQVPVGTSVVDNDGVILADLTADGQQTVIAKGGKGGFGNAHFVSSRRQTPRVAENGEPGQKLNAIFEMKMIADVGIVGLPNAGKSTLLSVISNAKPEIADYPFTTLHPNLGVVDIDGQHSLLFADIPGLIEGASQGKGLGDEFLRHVERTMVLVHLIDAYSEDVAADYQTIMKELAEYKTDLSDKSQIVALTKIEGLDKDQIAESMKILKKLAPKGTPLIAISSLSREGLDDFLRQTLAVVQEARQKVEEQEAAELPVIGIKEEDNWLVTKTDDGFVVTGPKIERFATRTRFGDFHAEQRLTDILAKNGIIKELEKQGIEAGQTIVIGRPEIGRLEY